LPDEGVRVSLDDKDAFAAELAKLAPKLKGKTVGAELSSTQADMLTMYFGDLVITQRTYSASDDWHRDLQTGRIDAALDLSPSFVSTIAEQAGGDLKLAGPLFIGGVLGSGTAIGLRHSDADLKAKFDAAIQAAVADGTVRKLSVRWFKTDISPPS
jgi:octopine/nopaline transport system substrate-binding protein